MDNRFEYGYIVSMCIVAQIKGSYHRVPYKTYYRKYCTAIWPSVQLPPLQLHPCQSAPRTKLTYPTCWDSQAIEC